MEKVAVLVRNQVDGDTEVAEATRATDAMQVGFGHLREVEVDDHVDGLDIDATSEEIGAHQIATQPVAEVVEDTISVRLRHAGMDIVAGVTELGDLLRQQLDTLGGVAEDDRLIDLQLREERVQTVHLLSLLYERVVLCDTLQGQFVHQIDLVRVLEVLAHELLHRDGKGGREEKNLSLQRQIANESVEHTLEVLSQQLVGLVQHEELAMGQRSNLVRNE